MDSFIVAKKNKALLQNNLIVKLLKKKRQNTVWYVVQYQRCINTLVCIYVYVYIYTFLKWKGNIHQNRPNVDSTSLNKFKRNKIIGYVLWHTKNVNVKNNNNFIRVYKYLYIE